MPWPLKDLRKGILRRSKLVEETFCWRWQRSTVGKKGYGKIQVRGRMWFAHRLAYAVFRDPTDLEGKQIHHLCGHKWCVNPWHLEAVTQSEHMKAQGVWGGPPKPGVRVKLRIGRLVQPITNDSPQAEKRRAYKRRYRQEHRAEWLKAKQHSNARYRARKLLASAA
jgi:hypothetical protein